MAILLRDPQPTARLLSSQASSLDVVDVSAFLPTLMFRYECMLPLLISHATLMQVVPLVPPDWPLSSLSSFLTHSFRRTLNAKHEGQIIKAICAGQNSEVSTHSQAMLWPNGSLQVFERSYLVFREQGAIIEEADDDDEDGIGEPESFDEKSGLAEKIALHLQGQQRGVNVADVHPSVSGGTEVDAR